MSRKLANFDSGEIEETLKKVNHLAEGMDDGEVKQLSGIVEVEEYDADELVLKEDDASRDLLVVKEGGVSVEILLTPNDSSAVQIQKLRNDNIIGEFSFIDGSRRSANVRTTVKTVIMRLPYQPLKDLIESNHTIGYKVMRNLAVLMSERLRNTNFELRSHLYL